MPKVTNFTEKPVKRVLKKIKVIKKGSTVTYTNSKLKKGKTYYYKIRSYKYDTNGKKIYSSWSSVKGKTSK